MGARSGGVGGGSSQQWAWCVQHYGLVFLESQYSPETQGHLPHAFCLVWRSQFYAGSRGSASDDARNAAEIVEHTLGRVLPCLLGALGALHTFSKSPVSLGAADQASVFRNSGGRSNDDNDECTGNNGAYFHSENHQHHAADECDSVMQRVRGQVRKKVPGSYNGITTENIGHYCNVFGFVACRGCATL